MEPARADVGGGGTRLPPAGWTGETPSSGWAPTPRARRAEPRYGRGAGLAGRGHYPRRIIVTVACCRHDRGIHGGRVDNLLMRLTDVVYAFPDLLFIIIIMTAAPQHADL